MALKNDCERDYIKEAFDKLYTCVMPYIDDLTQFDDAAAAFKELDKKVHSEMYILKKCLAEKDRAVDAGLTRSEVDRERISELEKQLAQENQRLKLLENSRTGWRSRAQHAEKRVMDLNKRISELEEENANLRVTPFDTLEALKKENSELRSDNKKVANACSEARKEFELYKKRFVMQHENNKRLRDVIDNLEKKIHELEEENAKSRVTPEDLMRENEMLRSTIEAMDKTNSALRRDNGILWSKLEEADIPKRPWHGDGNAMTGGRTCCESLAETIEFQNKKIEELEAEKARLKEAYDIQETTINRLKLLLTQQNEIDALKKENSKLRTLKEDMSYGHEFEFGDKVYVPWSDGPYMYIKTALMYNPRTERLVYVGKDQHLKWFGERFEIK